MISSFFLRLLQMISLSFLIIPTKKKKYHRNNIEIQYKNKVIYYILYYRKTKYCKNLTNYGNYYAGSVMGNMVWFDWEKSDEHMKNNIIYIVSKIIIVWMEYYCHLLCYLVIIFVVYYSNYNWWLMTADECYYFLNYYY